MKNIIEVNGQKYLVIEDQPTSPKKFSKSMAMSIFAQMAMMGGDYGPKREKEGPKVDIVKEYGLIQLKKSNLSKSQRDWVVWNFNKRFKKIEDHLD